MRKILLQHRPGTTLVELLLFVAMFAVCAGVVLSFFYSTTEHRVRQQVIMFVEQGGLQLLQTLTHRIRSAETVLDPPPGGTGSFLALQVLDEDVNPTIFTVASGAMIAVQKDAVQYLSRDIVTVTDFFVENTSIDDGKGSVTVRFTINNIIPLPTPTVYERTFETTVTLFPDDEFTEHCGCVDPACNSGIYQWEVCNASVCTPSDVTFPCE
ncbi:hypothetical protein H6770_01400 [Candidatus Peribacteria bacterium]|nr:hypothetical protein [Candidatus Peribacteria bacterium]